MRSDDAVRLQHMIDAAETAGQFMAGRLALNFGQRFEKSPQVRDVA